ncbi:hypothetical protein [Streptomyces sp. NPDC058664]|uniref:hypothetical protein n=1 Tax=unclassified Streptomyces TaxID=2593676 RepID=UPI003652AB74
MKPYDVHVQLPGTLAVVTLCPGRGRKARRGSPGLGDVPAAPPAPTDCLVLDLDHARGSAADGALTVRGWARTHAVVLAVLDGAAVGVPRSSWPDPAGAGLGAVSGPRAVREQVTERRVAQWALGIRRARRGAHPCSKR